MGLLDALLSEMTGASGPGSQAGANPLLQIALQLLAGGEQPGDGRFGGGASGGGLAALIDAFQRAGLGAQVNSWISSGQNAAISPDQLMQAFGHERLQQMAASSGLDLGQLSGGLAELLPALVDRVTPGGQVPEQGIDAALAELSRMVPRS
jgi:uncharacterized protein YidB (DUF937 family)